jgi:hypothetical protein
MGGRVWRTSSHLSSTALPPKQKYAGQLASAQEPEQRPMKIASVTARCPSTPTSSYSDIAVRNQAALVVGRATERPRSAFGAAMTVSDFYAVEQCVPRRIQRECGRIIRLEAPPFCLSRESVTCGASINLRGRGLESTHAATLAIAIANGAMRSCRDLDFGGGGNRMGDEGVEAMTLAIGGGTAADRSRELSTRCSAQVECSTVPLSRRAASARLARSEQQPAERRGCSPSRRGAEQGRRSASPRAVPPQEPDR